MVAVCFANSALAEDSGSGKAAAEALFSEAVQLTEAGQFQAACEKLAASQKLDPAVGTMLRLADCYDQIGRSASAWALFREVESLAQARNQPERSVIAKERALELEGRLTRVRFSVKESSKGLVIRMNDVEIPESTWGTALPVDPGAIRIAASAPGRQDWSEQFEVINQHDQEIAVPALVPLPEPMAAPAATRTSPREQPRSPSAVYRVLGWSLGGVGIAALGVGVFTSFRADALNKESFGACRREDPGLCTEKGVSLRSDAGKMADFSTLAFTAGGAFLASGVVLLLWDPSANESPGAASTTLKEPSREVAVRVESRDNGGLLKLQGTW